MALGPDRRGARASRDRTPSPSLPPSPSPTQVGYVGLAGGFTILEDDGIAPYVEAVKGTAGEGGQEMEEEAAPAAEGAAADAAPAAPMETE